VTTAARCRKALAGRHPLSTPTVPPRGQSRVSERIGADNGGGRIPPPTCLASFWWLGQLAHVRVQQRLDKEWPLLPFMSQPARWPAIDSVLRNRLKHGPAARADTGRV
jgi:hypothetical protein